jgi:hypothetical protein
MQVGQMQEALQTSITQHAEQLLLCDPAAVV